MQINDISETFPLYSTVLMTFIVSSRWIECPNIRKSLGNGFPMKKYIEAVVRKSSQLQILAEIYPFENFCRVGKKTLPKQVQKSPEKKTKLYGELDLF